MPSMCSCWTRRVERMLTPVETEKTEAVVAAAVVTAPVVAAAVVVMLEVMDCMPTTVGEASTRMEEVAAVAAVVAKVVDGVEVAVVGGSSETRKEFRQLPQLWRQPSRLPMWAYSQRLTPIEGRHWIN